MPHLDTSADFGWQPVTRKSLFQLIVSWSKSVCHPHTVRELLLLLFMPLLVW